MLLQACFTLVLVHVRTCCVRCLGNILVCRSHVVTCTQHACALVTERGNRCLHPVLFVFSLQCDAGVGTNALYEQLYHGPTKLLVLGAGCSDVSQATAQSSHIWNLVQVGVAMSLCVLQVYSPVQVCTALSVCVQPSHSPVQPRYFHSSKYSLVQVCTTQSRCVQSRCAQFRCVQLTVQVYTALSRCVQPSPYVYSPATALFSPGVSTHLSTALSRCLNHVCTALCRCV